MMADEKDQSSANQIENAALEVQEVDNELPTRYWLSFQFIGSAVSFALMGNSLLFGLSMPVNSPFC